MMQSDRRRAAIFCSTVLSPSVVLPALDLTQRMCKLGVVLHGGFQSELERDALSLALTAGASIVYYPARSAQNLSIPSFLKPAYSEGRVSIASSFPDSIQRPNPRLAYERNVYAARVAGVAIVLFAHPGSKTELLAHQLLEERISTAVLDVEVNQRLVQLGATPVTADNIDSLFVSSEN